MGGGVAIFIVVMAQNLVLKILSEAFFESLQISVLIVSTKIKRSGKNRRRGPFSKKASRHFFKNQWLAVLLSPHKTSEFHVKNNITDDFQLHF